MALFSLTLSDLERSVEVTCFQWPVSPELFKIATKLLLMMNRKSYIQFLLALFSLTLTDPQRSIKSVSCPSVVGRQLFQFATSPTFSIGFF